MQSKSSKAILLGVVGWAVCSIAMLGGTPAIAQEESMSEPRRMRTLSEPMSGLPHSAVVPATASSIRNAAVPLAGEHPAGRDKGRGIELIGPSRKESTADRPAASRSSMLTTLLALAGVVALFLGVNVVLKRFQPTAMRRLPNTLVEVLGTTTMGPKHQLLLLRFGNKLLLVSQQPGETTCLTEWRDPEEVESLSAQCKGLQPSHGTHDPIDKLQQLAMKSLRGLGRMA
jgi:flagellar biogenesis protein FliO